MTDITNSFSDTDVFGPYSSWPRRTKRVWTRIRIAKLAAISAAAGVFAHCVVPMIT